MLGPKEYNSNLLCELDDLSKVLRGDSIIIKIMPTHNSKMPGTIVERHQMGLFITRTHIPRNSFS